MKYIVLFIFLFLLFYPKKMLAQSFGFQFRAETASVEFPFEMYNNLIVVDLVLEKKLPVKFIFDTGAEHTVICKKEINH